MVKNHSVKLEPYKGSATRYTCPQCNKRKEFTRYIYTATGEHIADNVGICNRADKCGYHYTPAQYFADTDGGKMPAPAAARKIIIEKPSYTEPDILKGSLQGYEQNNFIQYLIGRFGVQQVQQVLSRYAVGTTDAKAVYERWQGATIFWQIDKAGKIRGGKVMQYNRHTGKRDKALKATWQHASHSYCKNTIAKQDGYNLKPCFFGEHLIKGNTKPIAIVESEKTAIIASLYLPMFIWLAAGGKGGLNADKCKAVQGRKVVLYPDLGKGFEDWQVKAKLFGFAISDLLERKATDAEKADGLDLADYLLQYELSEFINQPQLPADGEPIPAVQAQQQAPERNMAALAATIQATPITGKGSQPEPEPQQPAAADWRNELTELKAFFDGVQLPAVPIQVEHGSTIVNLATYIETNYLTALAQNGKPCFEVYLNRLKHLKQYLLQYERV